MVRQSMKCFFGAIPSYSHLKFIGNLCYATNKNTSKTKFDARTTCCIFLGYPYAQKGYKLYDLNNKRIFISRDVQFHENIFPFLQKVFPPSNKIVLPHSVIEQNHDNPSPTLVEQNHDDSTATPITVIDETVC